jgi:hypothetical protein
MTPASIRADYRKALTRVGSLIAVRRYTDPVARTFVDYPALARPMNYQPADLVGAIQQGDVKLIVLAEDLEIAGFPFPLRKGDKVFRQGKESNIEAPDGNSREVQGVLVAYELRVRG